MTNEKSGKPAEPNTILEAKNSGRGPGSSSEIPKKKRRGILFRAAKIAFVVLAMMAALRAGFMVLSRDGSHPAAFIGFFLGSLLDPVLFIVLLLPITLVLRLTSTKSPVESPPSANTDASGK